MDSPRAEDSPTTRRVHWISTTKPFTGQEAHLQSAPESGESEQGAITFVLEHNYVPAIFKQARHVKDA